MEPLPIKALPEILVDVVASYAVFNHKRCSRATSHSKTPWSVGSLHMKKDLHAKFEHTRNVKAQIAKLKP